jgi:hypothetical protein
MPSMIPSEDIEYIKELIPREFRSLLPAFLDPREPGTKRREFNRMRTLLYSYLARNDGLSCQLNLGVCDEDSGFDVDHLIPLSSNVLNKALRELKARPGKKVLTQAYGSNNPLNLVLACKRCNAHKKHNFPSVEQLGRILSIRLESG